MFSVDALIGEFDRALRAVAGVAEAARRSPAEGVARRPSLAPGRRRERRCVRR
jgi:hypothetical protein